MDGLIPEGTYNKEGYQLFNSLLSYGSAGWFGHGFQSVIKVISRSRRPILTLLLF